MKEGDDKDGKSYDYFRTGGSQHRKRKQRGFSRCGFTFDNTVPHAERAARILNAVKNPYCFRVGEIGVKLEFPEEAPALQDVFTDFLKRKKSGL